jgi:hypothetical protein
LTDAILLAFGGAVADSLARDGGQRSGSGPGLGRHSMDAHGNNLHADVEKATGEKLAELQKV